MAKSSILDKLTDFLHSLKTISLLVWNKYLYRKSTFSLLALIVFIAPPLLFFCWYENKLAITISPSGRDIIPISISKEIVGTQSSGVTEFSIQANGVLEKWLAGFDEYSSILNIQKEIIKYDLYVRNNVLAKVSYSESADDATTKQEEFTTTLSCMGSEIKTYEQYKIRNQLELHKEDSKDKSYVEIIIQNCLSSSTFGIQNTKNKMLYLKSGTSPIPDGEIQLLIRLSLVSKVLILFIWFGFLILVRDGPLKYLLKFLKEINRNPDLLT